MEDGRVAVLLKDIEMNKWIKSLVIIMLIPTKVIGSSQNELAKVSELLSVGQVNKAKLVLTHIERNDSNRLERQLLQIQIKFAESHFELVEEQLSTLIEQYPEDARLYIWYGRVSSVLARQASVLALRDMRKPAGERSRRRLNSPPQVWRAIKGYLQADLPIGLPSKVWASFRLSSLYLLINQPDLAKQILLTLKNDTKDESLAERVAEQLELL